MNTQITNTKGPESAWERLFADVGGEEWLTAKALLELDDHRTVLRDAAKWITSSGDAGTRLPLRACGTSTELELDWDAWVADVDTRGRGWSSTEYRLFDLVAGLVSGRPFNVVGVLDRMDSWEAGAWRILTEWGTGGDNRQRPGRLTVVPTTGVHSR
jgi:hypothetical protein